MAVKNERLRSQHLSFMDRATARGGYDDEVMREFTKHDAQNIDTKLKAAPHSFEFVK